MSEWQPMETAPKDDMILVWTENDCVGLAEYRTDYDPAGWYAIQDGFICQTDIKGERLFWLLLPTHWMAVPPAPT